MTVQLEPIDYSASLDASLKEIGLRIDERMDELQRAERRAMTLECAVSLALMSLGNSSLSFERQAADAKFYLEVALKRKVKIK